MKKDFGNWINLKEKVDQRAGRPTINEREVWWCHIGCNVGEESNGKNAQFSRPVLILKKLTRNSCVCLPLTSKDKQGTWYVPVSLKKGNSNIMLHQVRVIDAKRFTKMVERLDESTFSSIKEKFTKFYS